MPDLVSAACVRRYAGNPVLSARDVPYEALLVFNAGVTYFQGRYVMVFRNDYGRDPATPHPRHTNVGLAYSRDGLVWEVQPEPCFRWHAADVIRAYDPRLTVMDGRCYMCFAADTGHGIRGGIAVTDDFEHFDVLSLSLPDNRNMVLFPERIRGKYARLERPFPAYGRGGRELFDIWYGDSPDLVYWGNHQLVLGVEDVPYANTKLGPGAPPVKTPAGWLTVFHAVDSDPRRGKNGWEPIWQKRYTAGIMLLDLDDPARVVGMSKLPLLVPEAPYEVEGGFRNHTLFPGGLIVESSGEVKIYYGAADAVECLATADLGDLLKLCTEPRL